MVIHFKAVIICNKTMVPGQPTYLKTVIFHHIFTVGPITGGMPPGRYGRMHAVLSNIKMHKQVNYTLNGIVTGPLPSCCTKFSKDL
jgi:hypothetical protein